MLGGSNLFGLFPDVTNLIPELSSYPNQEHVSKQGMIYKYSYNHIDLWRELFDTVGRQSFTFNIVMFFAKSENLNNIRISH